MADVTGPNYPDDLKNEENRDVADLWKDALKAYKGIVGFDLEKRFDNVQAMIGQGTKEMNGFHKFRHNEKKVDKLRTLFATNIDYIQQGAEQLVSAATPAFPPAAAIGTAITFMLGACRQVSADYDVVVVFFEDMNSFLERIVILETRLPPQKAYQNCLMDVFTSFLTMCGYAHKYIELGRFKKWIHNLFEGEDSDLSGARKTMDTKLSRLQNATEFAILGNTEDIKKMNSELRRNSEAHTAMLRDQMQLMGSIHDTTEVIRNDMTKLLKAFDEQKKEKMIKPKGKSSAADQSKPASAKRIRNALPEVEGEDHEYHVLKDTIVPDTCSWVFNQPQWDQWLQDKQSNSLLAITGHPGSGKSHIGASVYDEMRQLAETDPSKHICTAHFYFREQTQSLSTLYSAIITIINQVVEQSAPICELIYIEYCKDENSINVNDWEDLTRKVLAPAFRKESKNQLYLMMDGIDELQDLDSFVDFLGIVKNEELRISIVVTSRPDIVPTFSNVLPTLTIEVEKEKQKEDLKELVWNRLNSLSAFRGFSRYVKQRVAEKVEVSAPNMLYAEHMLRRFNSLGREAAVLRNLDKPLPADLHDLYEILVDECYKHLDSNHEDMVNRLLHWIAYSFRSLTLDEVVSLLRLWANDKEFDIEEIPEPFAKFIQVGDVGADAEARAKIQAQGGWRTSINQLEKSQDASPDTIYLSDGTLPVKFHERSMISFFREAPRKDETRRWKTSEAHRQIFLDCAKMACIESEDKIAIPRPLKTYTVEYMVKHWRKINPKDHSTEEQAAVMEAFGAVMLNKHQFATIFDRSSAEYGGQFEDEAFDRVSEWAQLLEATKSLLSEDVVQWWSDMATNPRNCLLHLIEAHLKRLYTAVNASSAVTFFKVVRDAMQTSNMNDKLVEQAKTNFGDKVGDTTEPLTEAQAALAMEGLFEDVEMGASAYRAIACVLYHYKRYSLAGTTCLKAIEKATAPLEMVKTFGIMAKIELKRDADKAYPYAIRCIENLDHETVPPSLKRESYVTKARIEVELEKYDEAVESYVQARRSDPAGLTTGDVLDEEITIFSEDEDMRRYIDTLKQWSPLERLTWMAWDYEDSWAERHELIRDATAKTGEADFIVQIYKESIKYLENVNAAAPLCCDLALVHWQVQDNPETARKVLDEVLDGSSTGWPYAVTEETPNMILERAIGYQSDILWRLFQESSDPVAKGDILKSLQGMLSRPLALDVPPNSDTGLFQQPIAISRMYLKMGPALEAQKTLQGVINGCIEALGDNVGWNDSQNLIFLAISLCILGKISKSEEKLTRIARILLSAQFSQLDPNVTHNDSDEDDSESGSGSWDGSEVSEDEEGDASEEGSEEGSEAEEENDEEENNEEEAGEEEEGSGDESDGDSGSGSGSEEEEESDDDELPTDEGDLIGENGWRACDGSCNPYNEFNYWGDNVAYQCITCFDGFLCEECYENRQAANRGEPSKGRKYCGKDHEYLKMPIEGWHGVTNGKVMLEGEEPLDFQELLRQIRDEFCKEAWEQFWQG